MNEENKKIIEETEKQAAIEVDVTDEVNEEVVEVVEETKATEEELPAEENKEESEEVVEESKDDSEVTDEVKEDDEEKEQVEEEEQEEKQEEPEKEEEVKEEENEEPEPEPTEKEKELQARIEDMEAEKREAESLKELSIMRNEAEQTLNAVSDKVQKALMETIKRYDIPEDKTLNELRSESPEKAEILEGLLNKAQEVIQQASNELSAKVEDKARDTLFDRAGRLFDKYVMSDEQKDVAAETFINIMNQVGFTDLDEDLRAKIELCVGRAKMICPEPPAASEVVEVKGEAAEEMSVEDVVEEAIAEAEESEAPKAKAEPKPDLSEFMEGVHGSVPNTTDVTEDNVLAKMAGLPFKERTAFYKEHVDLINAAMSKRR